MKVQYLNLLRQVTGKNAEELPTCSVGKLLDYLIKFYGDDLAQHIFTPEGGLQGGLLILVNGRNICFLKGLETVLEETDVVSIIPPSAGG